MNNPDIIHDSGWIKAATDRIGDEILNEFQDRNEDLRIIGIQRRGVPFAQRIAQRIFEKNGIKVPVGTLDITMYRDDIGLRKSLPVINETNITFDLERRVLILADDVFQAGRTIRAAMDAITNFGRPGIMRLAIMIDRGCHEFPIAADYRGELITDRPDRKIQVSWTELNGIDQISFE